MDRLKQTIYNEFDESDLYEQTWQKKVQEV